LKNLAQSGNVPSNLTAQPPPTAPSRIAYRRRNFGGYCRVCVDKHKDIAAFSRTGFSPRRSGDASLDTNPAVPGDRTGSISRVVVDDNHFMRVANADDGIAD
jgi:hypothetical protein